MSGPRFISRSGKSVGTDLVRGSMGMVPVTPVRIIKTQTELLAPAGFRQFSNQISVGGRVYYMVITLAGLEKTEPVMVFGRAGFLDIRLE